MEAPFVEGLPYLSRLEEKQAMAKLAESEHSIAKLMDVNPKDMDPESQAFLTQVRRLIDAWINETGVRR